MGLSGALASINVRTMLRRGAGDKRPVRPGFRIAATLAATLPLSACISMSREGPPAPVIDRSGIYYTAPAADTPPVTAAPRSSVARASAPGGPPQIVSRGSDSDRRSAITSAPLDPLPQSLPRARPQSGASAPAQRASLPAGTGASRSAPASRPLADAGRSLDAAGAVSSRGGGRVTVGAGETLYAISRRENVPLRALIEANRLRPPYGLRAGQQLTVPAVRVYVVAPGDTVSTVAGRYDVPVSEMIRQNDLKAPDFGLFAGQRLVLPWQGAGGQEVRNRAVPARAVQAPPDEQPLSRIELADPDADPPKRAGAKFLWPVQGRVVSSFGSKGGGLYNDGINIAADDGDIVRAAENGIVAYAGNELRGYGNLLLVRHADGWVSAYAHNGEFLVRRGQVVKRGQPIARVGRSGAVAEPQLHFELRRGRKAVDPRPHLAS
ncbi:MAG: hypothetical protein RL477_2206 [Pseudomonadota bacterium]